MLKRAILPVAAAILTVLALIPAYWNAWWLLVWVLTLPTVALGIYDYVQTRWTITRNYPVAARIRWLFYDLRPFLRAYIVEGDLEGKPFPYEARNLVHARARGETDTHPFGTELDTEAEEYLWLNHSMAPANTPDMRPRVTVGNAQCSKPYSASVLNISAMSFGALSARAIEALNLGAKQGDFYHDTGEGGLSPYHLKHGGDIVWELGSGYFGARDGDGNFEPELFRDQAQNDAVKMTEIKLSQGAKPGHGGLLPAAKVTEEIARVRKVPAHQDCLSPRGHKAFKTPCEMMEFAARMRDLSGGKPVGLKLCVGQPHEVFALVKAMRKTGIYPDFIVVDGGEGGTGAAPQELSDSVGTPLIDGLILMRNALVGSGVRDKVRLAASGKVYSGFGLAHNLAIGADWCNAARAFMFSIGCIQAQRCHLGTCPTGVTTQDPSRQRGLVPEVQGERAARFHGKTLDALADIVAAAGITHPTDLQPHHIVHRVGVTQARTIDTVYPFLPEGVLLDDPDSTDYADWWNAADPDSFAPRFPLERVRESTRAHEKEA
ncbi:glutamate synthase [Defluviimonas sp. 20V17]|uniref:FMN-binding glutamate synthase family protein n=1 Tax=Allgaiera indica TaxID=765699 RepID=A0AAN4USC0_9RHOB|nr:FMN-binding glutamate synthase family protein [Allgaiera indica]KDB02209.1 glutamate synthase [Defluviimonas sp. 20V17]GHE02734.1 FMN-binding glutamate synthase family protein [Allgaiera indica]SDX18529.1 Glutamate synthase domain-containing protein 2 [Allgaiera indica]